MPGNMKNLIADTFAALMMKKDIDKISVKDLVEACNISRQTFYYHFQDLLQVIEWGSDQQLQQALASSLQARTLEDALEIFLNMAVSQHKFIQRLLQSQRREHLEKVFVSAIEEYLTGVLQHRLDLRSVSMDDLTFAKSFYTHGVVGVLLNYCGREDLDTKKLARQLAQLLTSQSVAP